MARIPREVVSALRRHGLDVTEVSGCWGRGSSTFSPQGIIVHATAGSASASDSGELNVILKGSTSAPPPIAQFMLGREGKVYFVADGRCNHALQGFRGTRFAGVGNSGLIGIEGCNNNRGEDWSRSYHQYVTLVAVLCMFYAWNPVDRVRGHKEHQPGDKSDPTFDMAAFRRDVAQRITELSGAGSGGGSTAGGGVGAVQGVEDDDMTMFFFCGEKEGNPDGHRWAFVSGGAWFEYNQQTVGTHIAGALRGVEGGKPLSATVCTLEAWEGLKAPFVASHRVFDATPQNPEGSARQ